METENTVMENAPERSGRLIARILEDAERAASGVLAEAQARAEALVAEAESYAEKLEIEMNAKISANVSEIAARSKTVAELDAGKIILKAKVDAVDACFDRAVEEICGMKDAAYLKFIKRLIAENAEDGDAVTVSKADAKRVSAEFIKKLAAEKKLKLTLSKAQGNFRGGVILTHGGIDKNLTVEMLVKERKAALTPEVLKLLQIA